MLISSAPLLYDGSAYELRQFMIDMDDLCMQEAIIKLDDAQFGGDEFPNFAREAMHRYNDSNRGLYKLILKMKIIDNRSSLLATELILYALNNLSVRKMHLEFSYSGMQFDLPYQVFESKSLTELTATYCRIAQPISESVVILPLVALDLMSVTIGDGYPLGYSIGNEVMRSILDKCPLLEHLCLQESLGFNEINLSRMHNLKFCGLVYLTSPCSVEFFGQGRGQFRNMTSLILVNDFHLESSFFHDFMFKFPSLRELSFHNCTGFEELEISSPALEFLNLELYEQHYDKRLVLNVPSIRGFSYWGSKVPPLLISTCSKELESDIALHILDGLPKSWFLKLREYLQKLSLGKVSLGLTFDFCAAEDPCTVGKLTEEDTSGVPSIHLENLFLDSPFAIYNPPLSTFADILSGLFSFCRPKFITLVELVCYPLNPEIDLSALEVLRKLVTEQVDWKSDLKQVTFEVFNGERETTLEDWRPVLWDDLISSLKLQKTSQVRFKLAWNGDQSN